MEYLTLFARQTAFFDLILPERKYTEAEGKYHTGGQIFVYGHTAEELAAGEAFLGDLERARIPYRAGGAERRYTYSEEGEACV